MVAPTPGSGLALARPFQPTNDPKRLWLLGPFAETLIRLRNAVAADHGLLVLQGEVGTGKTTLVNVLIEQLAADGVRVGKLPYAGSPLEFHTAVAEAFGLSTSRTHVGALLEDFVRFLDEAAARGERVLLVIDQAQGLRPALRGPIRRLLEADRRGSAPPGVLGILLVGDHLGGLLGDFDQGELARLVTFLCELRPLRPDEVTEFVRHRLSVADISPDRFTPEALLEVAAQSRGILRVVNLIGERALAAAHVRGQTSVGVALVRECAETFDRMETVPRVEPVEERADRRRSLTVALAAVAIAGVVAGVGYTYRLRGDRNEPPRPVHAVEQRPITLPPAAPVTATVPDRAPSPSATPRTTPELPATEPRATPAPPVRSAPPAQGLESPSRRVDESAARGTNGGAAGRPATSAAAVTTKREPPPKPPAPARAVAPSAPQRAPATTDEPDPAGIIDWLLKDSSRRTD